jgi:hypothetical protein
MAPNGSLPAKTKSSFEVLLQFSHPVLNWEK